MGSPSSSLGQVISFFAKGRSPALQQPKFLLAGSACLHTGRALRVAAVPTLKMYGLRYPEGRKTKMLKQSVLAVRITGPSIFHVSNVTHGLSCSVAEHQSCKLKVQSSNPCADLLFSLRGLKANHFYFPTIFQLALITADPCQRFD